MTDDFGLLSEQCYIFFESVFGDSEVFVGFDIFFYIFSFFICF